MSELTLDRAASSDAAALPPQLLEGVGAATADLGPIWIVEEAAGHLRTQGRKGPASQLRLYRLLGDILTTVGERTLTADVKRTDAVMSMLRQAGADNGVVVCSHRAAAVPQLAEQLELYGMLHYVLEVHSTRSIEFARAHKGVRIAAPKARVEGVSWTPVKLSQPAGSSDCFAANLGKATLGLVDDLTCFALSIGGIDGYQRGVLIGMTSLTVDDKLKRLAQLLAWTRWIRLAVRRAARSSKDHAALGRARTGQEISGKAGAAIQIRANRRLASSHDLREAKQRAQLPELPARLERRLTADKKHATQRPIFSGGSAPAYEGKVPAARRQWA